MDEHDLMMKVSSSVADAFEAEHGSDLVDRANTLASREGLDGKYIQFLLERDSSDWPSMSRTHQSALKALADLSEDAYAFDWDSFKVPSYEEEGSVNDIIKKLGKWAHRHRKDLLQTYFKALGPHVKEARRLLESITTKSWSDRDVMIWMHAALKDAIRNNPAGIASSVTLSRILDLIL